MGNESKNLGLAIAKQEHLVKAPDFIRVYANNVQMTITLWDMNLVFGEAGETKDGQPTILQKVKVNMTRELAKALYNLLGANLAAYESQLGEIQILNPQVYEKAIDTAMKERYAKIQPKPKRKKPRTT